MNPSLAFASLTVLLEALHILRMHAIYTVASGTRLVFENEADRELAGTILYEYNIQFRWA